MFDNVRRIFGHLLIYGSADVAILAINFLLLPIYTRVLSPSEYGVLALILVVEAFLKVLFRWGLDSSFLRLYYDCPTDDDKRTLAGTIGIFLLAVNGPLTLALVAAAPLLADALLGSREHLTALTLLLVNSFVAGFFFLPLSVLRIQQRSRLFATLTFLRSFGTVIVRLVLVVGFRMSVTGITLADLIVSSVLLVSLSRTFRSMIRLRFSRGVAREMLRFGFPRVPQGLLHQGMAMSDRFFLSLYLPLEQVGVYLIASSIASLIKLYPVAFTTAWMPFAFDSMRRPDAPQLFGRLATYAFGVLALATLAIVGLSKPLVELMTPASFHEAAKVVPILAVGMAIQATTTFLSTSINVAKRTHAYPIATAIAAVVTIVGHLALIPRWGVFGAAVAVGVGQITLVGSLGSFAQRYFRIHYEWSRLGRIVVVAAGLYGIMVLLPAWSNMMTLAAGAALLAFFPLALLAFGFFRSAEIQDLKRLAERLRPKQAGVPARTSRATADASSREDADES